MQERKAVRAVVNRKRRNWYVCTSTEYPSIEVTFSVCGFPTTANRGKGRCSVHSPVQPSWNTLYIRKTSLSFHHDQNQNPDSGVIGPLSTLIHQFGRVIKDTPFLSIPCLPAASSTSPKVSSLFQQYFLEPTISRGSLLPHSSMPFPPQSPGWRPTKPNRAT